MAKISISRIFETSRALATKSGQELSDVVQFLADLAEQTLRALRNGLTYGDNFDCEPKFVQLRSGVATVISVTAAKPVKEVRVRRFLDTRYPLASWIWYVDQAGALTVQAVFAQQRALASYRTTGGGTSETIPVPGVASTNRVLATLNTPGASPVTLSSAGAVSGGVALTFSADPSTDHVLTYQVLSIPAADFEVPLEILIYFG